MVELYNAIRCIRHIRSQRVYIHHASQDYTPQTYMHIILGLHAYIIYPWVHLNLTYMGVAVLVQCYIYWEWEKRN